MKEEFQLGVLWSKSNYRSELGRYFSGTIVEYDMKSANTSLAREFGLLPIEKIDELDRMPKKQREISVGLIKRNDKSYNEKEKEAFASARKMFCEKNKLYDHEILSIKRDAIFTTRYVKHEQVTDNILFRMKNVYSSYIFLNPIEVYYNSENGLDVKGIDDEMYQEKHSEYFGDFLCEIIKRVECSSKQDALKYLRDFHDQYKWLRLPSGYYREFNAQSKFRYKDGALAGEEYRSKLDELDISTNFNLISQLALLILS